VDLASGEVFRGPRVDRLTGRERELLAYLVAHQGRDVPRDELLTHVWGYAPTARTRAIDNMVRKLRAKVELDAAAPRHVVTVEGGYRFAPVAAPTADARFPNPFFGQHEVLAAAEAVLAEPSGAAVLVGPPGVGKTRVAWELVRRWRSEHRWMCGLQEATTADDLVGVVAREVGVSQAGIRELPELIDRIGLALAGRGPALLALDNLEQLPRGALAPVRGWLASAPQLRIVATSRHPLAPLRAVPVPPLPTEVAAALFTDRARRVWSDFVPLPEVAALCDALDGLPLALEIAAARTSVLAVPEILGKLSSVLGLLRSPGEGHSLEAALAWSWGLLSPEERDALAQCTVFADGFDADAAIDVVQPSGLDGVHALVDRSLLLAERPAGRVRLRALVGVAAFVAQQTGPGALDAARDRHMRHFVTRIRADPAGTIATDEANARAALEWALHNDADAAAELAVALSRQLEWRVPAATRADWLHRALEVRPGLAWRTRLRYRSALLLAARGHRAAAVEEASIAEREAREGDASLLAEASMGAGCLCSVAGEHERGVALIERAWALEFDDERLRQRIAFNAGVLTYSLGRLEEAVDWFQRSLALPTDDPRDRITASVQLAHAMAQLGRPAESEAWAAESLAAAERSADHKGRTIAWLGIASLRTEAGRHSDAIALTERARRLAEESGDRGMLATALYTLGTLHLDLGDPAAACQVLEEALVHQTVLDRRTVRGLTLWMLGIATWLADRPGGIGLMRQSIAELTENPALCAGAHAIVAMVTPDPEEARDALLAAARCARERPNPLPEALVALASGGEPQDLAALAARYLDVRLALAVRDRRG
jgi:predicted ATPase